MMKQQGNIKIFSAPFASFSIPSLEIASLSAYLKFQNIQVEVCYLGYEYAYFLGWSEYKILRDTEYGRVIFSELLFDMTLESGLDQIKLLEFKEKTQFFSQEYIKRLNISTDTIVIFHNYHAQLFAALYFARMIKNMYACEIWFTGFHCEGELGANLQELFPFIDETIGTDLEENVFRKATQQYTPSNSDLDFLPTPDFDDFYKIASKLKNEIPAFKKNNITYQVEYSRGCKWNKCSFCTLNCHSSIFRERSTKLLLRDYKKISSKYHTTLICPEHFVVGNGWQDWLMEMTQFYEDTSRNLNLNFKVSDLLDENSFKVLHNAKADILVGTESFSNRHLRLLNKGQRVIENIQVLKYSKRWNVPCFHNFMYGLPYEDDDMYLENKKNIEYIYHLQPPFDIEEFRLTYGSEIYKNFRKYNIKNIFMKQRNQYLFPDHIRKLYIPFFYDFEIENNTRVDPKKWKSLIDDWRQKYYQLEYSSNPSIEPALVISTYGKIYQIIDRRYDTQITYNLTETQWKVYSYLDQIRSTHEIHNFLEEYNESFSVIDDFISKKLIFKEEDFFVALAI